MTDPSPDPVSDSASRIAWYQARVDSLIQEIDGLIFHWKRLSLVRGILFLVSATLLISGFAAAFDRQTLWFILSGLVFAGFLGMVFWHEGLESQLNDDRIWLRLNRQCLARLNRNWDQLPVVPVEPEPEFAALSNDLDLFGRASLFQLIGGVQTPMGIRLLRRWMVTVPDVPEIVNRQLAVGELRQQDEFRDRLRFLCHRLASSDGGPDRLLAWSTAPRQFDRRRILIWISRTLALAMFVAVVLVLARGLPLETGGPLILGILTVNFMLTVVFAARIHTQFNQVSTRHGDIRYYRSAFQHVLASSFASPRLVALHEQLSGPQGDVLTATTTLGRIAWMANLRRHGMLFIAWWILQFGFLWDFHVVERLQQWKAKYGDQVGNWMAALAQWEVLAALGQHARDHAEWAVPQIRAQPAESVIIDGRDLGHPLLPASRCIRNDVTIGPPGSVLLVTGSNMSGKSTLLRAIGANTVLAQLGANVCASRMCLAPMRIETSMRIQDSLADGVSFFMAELKRLKQIVDVARDYEQRPDVSVLFLLDEILQGTNSRERHIAVTQVVSHLIRHGAIGAVSTHDLELGTAAELAEACRPIHFRESFTTENGKKQMTFDYRVRPGIATTTNALELLKLVGLDEA